MPIPRQKQRDCLRFRRGALRPLLPAQVERREDAGLAQTSDTPRETLREWACDDRVTLAIVFTDIVGAAALGRALGDEQMNGLRRSHFAHSRALLAQHAGREIKTIGDSVMAVFRSIGAALDYAHALHLNPGHTALRARGVRAGIHIGSVDVVGEDIFGTEVDVAARVVGGIESAEIWLSCSDQAKRDLETRRRAPS